MSSPQSPFHRLVDSVSPSKEAENRIWKRIHASMEPKKSFTSVVASVRPNKAQYTSIKERILARIAPPIGEALKDLSTSVGLSRPLRYLEALEPTEKAPAFHAWLRWSAAFVLVIFAFRVAPLVLLPSTSADAAVQLIPNGKGVQVFVGGVWRTVDDVEVLKSASMISTDPQSEVTIVLNDDGVLRLAPGTTLRLHDLGDRPQHVSTGPTATLVRGTVWALGLLPPFIDGLSLETENGVLALNSGSASVSQEQNGATEIEVYDRGVTFTQGIDQTFLVSGEKLRADSRLVVSALPDRAYTEAWAIENLSNDAVHRSEIAKLQEEMQKKVAGILPGSALYPVKRVAEKVDALFAFTSDAKTQKHIEQANTRLSEALELIQEGEDEEAAASLSEYTTSLVTLAETGDDSLVRHLLSRTIAKESTSATDEGAALLKKAISEVAATVPDADLTLRDLEGYLLVDKLAEIRHALQVEDDPEMVASLYTEIRPYLSTILNDESDTNPLLKREAESLLLSTSKLAQRNAAKVSDPLLIALDTDVSSFLPEESDALKVTAEELDAKVALMVERIYVFRHPHSRYTQLLTEMKGIENDPNRGTLLRRLKAALPEGLGAYVNTELKKLTDELNG